MPCGCLDIKTREEQIWWAYWILLCCGQTFRLLIYFRHVAHMPRVKLGNLPCFEETPGGPFDEWVWALPWRCIVSREPLPGLENSELELTEEEIEGRGWKLHKMWEIRGGGRVERGNMGLNKLEIFALCLVHIWIGEQICIIHQCKLFGLMNWIVLS